MTNSTTHAASLTTSATSPTTGTITTFLTHCRMVTTHHQHHQQPLAHNNSPGSNNNGTTVTTGSTTRQRQQQPPRYHHQHDCPHTTTGNTINEDGHLPYTTQRQHQLQRWPLPSRVPVRSCQWSCPPYSQEGQLCSTCRCRYPRSVISYHCRIVLFNKIFLQVYSVK